VPYSQALGAGEQIRMSRLDDLPADQRATLSLLLAQGKDYAEVAQLLQIGEQAVHDRAHAALAVLAPREARDLTPQRREEIGDYLLGQRSLADRMQARSLLEDSATARAWAGAIAAELAPLASGPLPEIPAGPAADDRNGVAAAQQGSETAAPQLATGEASSLATAAPASTGGGPPDDAGARPGTRDARLPSSRVGGAIVLAVIAAVVVAVVLITSGGGSSHHRASTTASSTRGSSTSRATETKRLTLTSPSPSSKALGVAAVLQERSTYAFYLAAERLAPSRGFFYAVWLYNSPTSYEPLSKSPPVGSDGRLQGGALLPSNAAQYHQMILTRETSEHPGRPGPIVLQGEFALH
jgi:hypothetical protein